jgi:hypothetical protein
MQGRSSDMELTNVVRLVNGEASGERALRHVARIVQFHRIQASRGYRAAAYYCLSQFKQMGLDAELLSYPFDGENTYWGMPSFPEWHAEEATLELLEPRGQQRKLADFAENKMSLIQRSVSTPGNGIVAPLVRIENADRPESYRKLDLRGKIVFTSTPKINIVYEEAVNKRKAAGIVTDHVRRCEPVRDDLAEPDAVSYTSFWWGMKDTFGFVLSPREGAELRRICAENRKVTVRARVNSESYSGTVDNVTARIEGEHDRELLLISHLCHPQPSANDNASGVGALLESARILTQLFSNGSLAKPRYSIRFLLVPEMTGTVCYLASDEHQGRNILAGINLDMVGQNQHLCGSSLCFEDPPLSSHLFMVPLLESVWDRFALDCSNPGRTGRYSSARHSSTPFSGGSDHLVLSDPTIDIPTPLLIQWPDRYYHTDLDTIDKVDPEMLEKVAVLAGSTIGFLATLDSSSLCGFLPEFTSRAQERIARGTRIRRSSLLLKNVDGNHRKAVELARAVSDYGELLTERYTRSLSELAARFGERTDDEKKTASFCRRQLQRFGAAESELAAVGIDNSGAKRKKAGANASKKHMARSGSIVPERMLPGPVPLFLEALDVTLNGNDRQRLRGLASSRPEYHTIITSALFWVDGQTNLRTICSLVERELGYTDEKLIEAYFRLLKKTGLLRW